MEFPGSLCICHRRCPLEKDGASFCCIKNVLWQTLKKKEVFIVGNLSTKDLTETLLSREGITYLNVEPYEKVKITAGHSEKEFTGPAIIIINQD